MVAGRGGLSEITGVRGWAGTLPEELCEVGRHGVGRAEGGPTVSVLLREVLDIPEQAGAEDYVLRLTDSIEPAVIARTVTSMW